MAKAARRHKAPFDIETVPRRREAEPLVAQTIGQRGYMTHIRANDLTFGLGPAGTGKTFLAVALAADALRDGTADRLVITRPTVDCDEALGYLPGDQDEKFHPYLAPVLDVLTARLGAGHLTALLRGGRILAVPLGKMRGRTFSHTWVVADEMQNATAAQIKMLLTRFGTGCKMIVNGDIEQADIEGSGLQDAAERLSAGFRGLPGVSGVGIHLMTEDDIVRHGLVKDILARYKL